jgi:hypothetical protein
VSFSCLVPILLFNGGSEFRLKQFGSAELTAQLRRRPEGRKQAGNICGDKVEPPQTSDQLVCGGSDIRGRNEKVLSLLAGVSIRCKC